MVLATDGMTWWVCQLGSRFKSFILSYTSLSNKDKFQWSTNMCLQFSAWFLKKHLHCSSDDNEQIAIGDLQHILSEVNTHILPFVNDLSPIRTIAGGSVANTIRGLAAGFGISSGIICACGDDDEGRLFIHNMSYSGVDLTRLRTKKGHTSQVTLISLPLTSNFDG